MENSSFITFDQHVSGMLYDDSSNTRYPIRYYNVINGKGCTPEAQNGYYIFVYDGQTHIDIDWRTTSTLSSGMYAATKGSFCFHEGCYRAVVIEVLCQQGDYKLQDFTPMFTLGGPIEAKGRLRYIDGCSDSLLVPPVKLGNPCLNHLHFPVGINQTLHTHPSHRIGLVVKGYGSCITPFGNMPLEKGTIFIIKAWDGGTYYEGDDGQMYPEGLHAFKTTDSSMDVIAFHPDSDFGPTDTDHPMINRTIVDGVSASVIDEIRTKNI